MSTTVASFQKGQSLSIDSSNVSLLDDPVEFKIGQQIANWGRSPLSANQQKEVPMGRCDALLYTIAAVTMIGLIVFGSLAIAEKVGGSFAGWTVVALTMVELISLIAKFMVSSEEQRTGTNCVGFIGCPLVLSAAPLVCGILTGLGTLSEFTTGCVTIGTMSGLSVIMCCFAISKIFKDSPQTTSPSNDPNQQITQQAIRADQYV